MLRILGYSGLLSRVPSFFFSTSVSPFSYAFYVGRSRFERPPLAKLFSFRGRNREVKLVEFRIGF